MHPFNILVACDLNRGIGKNGALPWKLPGEMAYFKQITTQVKDVNHRNAVIMGRKTWLSIPVKFRPLKNRLNIVLTRDPKFISEGAIYVAHDLNQAIILASQPDIENIFVIGGAAVYREALGHPDCQLIYLTQINKSFDCDTFLPDFSRRFEHVVELDSALQRDGDIEYIFEIFKPSHKDKADNNLHHEQIFDKANNDA